MSPIVPGGLKVEKRFLPAVGSLSHTLSPDDCSVAGDPVVSCMLLPYLHLTLVFSPQESSLPCCCGSTSGKPLRSPSPQVPQVRPSPHRQEVLWGSSVWRSRKRVTQVPDPPPSSSRNSSDFIRVVHSEVLSAQSLQGAGKV